MGRIFGTDGARGVAVTELTCERAMEIGRAAAYVLTKESGKAHPNIIVGMDTRISSKILEAALSAGLASVGAMRIFPVQQKRPGCCLQMSGAGL